MITRANLLCERPNHSTILRYCNTSIPAAKTNNIHGNHLPFCGIKIRTPKYIKTITNTSPIYGLTKESFTNSAITISISKTIANAIRYFILLFISLPFLIASHSKTSTYVGLYSRCFKNNVKKSSVPIRMDAVFTQG